MKKDMSRRGFLTTAGLAAMAAGIGLAGCTSKSADGGASVALTAGEGGTGGNVPAKWDEECDVLVLGAGGAGTSAALAAAKAGASVIVLDSQTSNNFNATSICKGNFCVVGSDEQKALGIEDSVEKFLEDAIANGNSDGNIIQANREDAIRTYAENSARGYQLLKELGLEFPDPYVQVGHSLLRCHVVDNAKMLQLLTDSGKKAGADYRFETEFTKLVYDGAGTVLGAIAQSGSKEIAFKAKKAVLMCTGSFLRNVELVEECAMGFSKIPLFTGQGLTGLGHLSLMSLGGAMWGRECIYACEGDSEDGKAYTAIGSSTTGSIGPTRARAPWFKSRLRKATRSSRRGRCSTRRPTTARWRTDPTTASTRRTSRTSSRQTPSRSWPRPSMRPIFPPR